MIAFIIGAGFAIVLWIALQRWRPTRRWVYVFRVTLYGAIPGAYFMGRALSTGRIAEGLQGWLGAWILLLPITVSIGVVLAAKRLGLSRPR